MENERAGANHPQARRMALIACCSQNLTMSAAYGTFGVLLLPVEARLGMTREVSALGLPLVMAVHALMAPVAGLLSERVSLRLLMILGSLMGMAGYVVLATTSSPIAYLIAYALLIGPNVCLAGVMLPSILVTRWYAVDRGRALGLVNMPLLMGGVAVLAALLVKSAGLTTVYALLAGMLLIAVVPLAFVVDRPPRSPDRSSSAAAAAGQQTIAQPLRTLLADQRFWMVTAAFGASIAAQVVLGAHLAAMVSGWGVERVHAAALVSVSAAAGLLGTPALGWLADRLGARWSIVVLCLDSGILWLLLLLQPSYVILALIVFLMGFHGGATITVFAAALSDLFGPASFSRSFGFSKLLTLPFTLLSVPLVASVYVRTGSYTSSVTGLALFLFVGATLALVGLGRRGTQSIRDADRSIGRRSAVVVGRQNLEGDHG